MILIDCHKCVHEFLQLQQSVAASHAANLVVLLYAIRLDAGIVDDERYGLFHVGADLYRSRMVGQDGDAYRLVPSAYLVEDWFDESLVEVLDGFELQFRVAVVTSLVACLYVHINEVVAVLQRPDSCCCLSLVVGVGKTSSAFNDDVAQSGVMADASYQVYCRNHRTLL